MLPKIIDTNGFNAVVKAKYGYVIYNKNDIYIGKAIEKYGEFSELEVELFKQLCRIGDIVVEIGANIGTHTQVFSQLVGHSGRVIAFEPQRIIFQTLCANMALNSIINVECYPFAVGAENTTILLPDIDYQSIGNFGGIEINKFKQGHKVQVIKLDDFLDIPRLRLLKIDVEGMEYEVINGAKQLIEKHKPILYVENDRKDKSKALIQLIQSLGYRLFWHTPPLFNPNNFANCTENNYENIVSINMLCFHQSMQLTIKGLEEVINTNHQENQALIELALVYQESGDIKEALTVYQTVLKTEPNNTTALHLSGLIQHQLGHDALGIELIEKALKLNPNLAEAYNNLGIILKKQNKLDQAILCYQKAIALVPDYIDAYNNLGLALKKQHKLEETIKCYRKIIELHPNHVNSHYNLALALQVSNKLDEAILSYQTVIALNPNFAEAYNNLAYILKDQNKIDSAIYYYEIAISLAPEQALPYFNLALAQLTIGNYQQGWENYEWRFKCQTLPDFKSSLSRETEWQGELLEDKTLLVCCEQGFGDAIQFVRYVLLFKKDQHVIVRCNQKLKQLFYSILKPENISIDGEKTPVFDFHIGLMSLPRLFNTCLNTIPLNKGYLKTDKHWLSSLPLNKKVFNIGFVWAGNKEHKNNHNRSVDLNYFLPFFDLKNCHFYSLQIGEEAAQLAELKHYENITDCQTLINDFSDTAAIIEKLDLVISIDSSVAHLTGALGKPVWVLLPFHSDWRWLLDREDSPWYASARLFRQAVAGDWKTVFAKVKQALLDCQLNWQSANY